VEITAHRFVWSLVFMTIVMTAGRQWPAVARAIADRRVIAILLVTALLIGVNWWVFIHAVVVDRIVAASIGYFMNPVVSVLLGFVILRERLSAFQWVAVALASAGVLTQVVAYGTVPWITLVLAFTFATYGLIRKTAPVSASSGLLIETALLFPVAFGILAWFEFEGSGAFGSRGLEFAALLAFAGVATGLPLLLYAAGAKRIKLATMGLLQYIAPSGNLLIAVWVFDEPFTGVEALTFGFIWLALIIYTVEIWRTRIV